MATARGIIIDGKEWIYTKNERIEMKRLYELRGERKVLNFFLHCLRKLKQSDS